jgi:hypothetical protein
LAVLQTNSRNSGRKNRLGNPAMSFPSTVAAAAAAAAAVAPVAADPAARSRCAHILNGKNEVHSEQPVDFTWII